MIFIVFQEKYNSEDYSNKMRGMEDDFEVLKIKSAHMTLFLVIKECQRKPG